MPKPDQRPLFAGLDVSTQSTKLVVIDLEAGAVLHVDRVEYDRDLPAYETTGGATRGLGHGVSESEPRMWIEAVDTLLGRLRDSGLPANQIRALSVSGQQHGLVALTADGGLARPRAKLWNDFSTGEECRLLTEAVGGPDAMIREVGNSQRTGYTAAKIFHMRRHEPDNYRRAATFFLVHNFVNWYLTGGPQGGIVVMEPGDTSGMALWHPGTERWSDPVLSAIDPELESRLPPVKPADRAIGRVAPALAQRFGLSAECLVDAGSGDNMYGAVGTGNVVPGIVTVSLGTSGTAYTVLDQPFVDPTGEIAAFCDSTGQYLPLVCVSNMANGYDSLLHQFGLSHEEFDGLVGRTAPGSGGRIIVPWYEGERTPDVPLATPAYFGFVEFGDFAAETLCRAVLEGHVLNLHHGCTRLPVSPREIRLTGGLSASPSWRQAIADVFGADAVPVRGEGAALGAAIHAAWIWQRERGAPTPLPEIAAPFVTLDEACRARPVPQHQRTYELVRRLYAALVARLRGTSGEDPFALRTQLREGPTA
jgi:xylulokinase